MRSADRKESGVRRQNRTGIFSNCAVGAKTTPPPAGGTPPKEGNGVRGLFNSPPVEGRRAVAGLIPLLWRGAAQRRGGFAVPAR